MRSHPRPIDANIHAMSIRRVLVVDDEPRARERVAALVRDCAPAAEIREAHDGDEAVEQIAGWHPDAVFLDVQMPGLGGFDVVAAIGPVKMPPTVFVTAFDAHAIRAFDVAALDYLLKPFDAKRFRAAWDRVAAAASTRTVVAESRKLAAALAALTGEQSASPGEAGARADAPHRPYADRVVVKRGERIYFVKLAGVQWIESNGNYVTLHAGTEAHIIRETLTSLEARLDPRQFVRIHRRVIVSLDAMRELQPWFGGDQVMILKDGRQLRVSRTYREHLASAIAAVA